MPAGTLSKLFVRIGADTKDFQDSMSGVQNRMAKVGQGISNVGKGMTKWVTGPIAAVGGAMFELARRTGNYADEILDLSAATGHSTEAIQEYQAIADRAGTSTDAFTNASQTLTRQMTRGEEGSATLRRGLDELGLTFQQLQDASPDDRMELIADRLRDIEDEGKRAELGTQLLRGSYEDLAPILDMTEEEMKAVTDQAHESGKIMGDEALEEANKFREGLDELKQEFTGLFRSIAVEFMPVLTDQLMPAIQDNIIPLIRSFSETITGLIERFMNLDPRTQKIIIAATGLAAALGPVLIVVGKLITAISALIPVITSVGSVIGGVALGPIALIAGAVAGLVAVWYYWEDIIDFVKGFAKMITDIISGLVDGIVSAFSFMYDNTIGIFESMWNGIQKIINYIIEGMNKMIRGLNRISIDIPDWVPGLGGETFGINISEIPKLAVGGIGNISGTALIGEEGPELVELPKGASVRPLDSNDQAQKIDMTVNQHITDKATAEHANNDLLKKLKDRGLAGAYR